MTPTIKLIYFNLTGRAEPTRLALAIGGYEFEDERVTFEEFGEIRETGVYPFKSLPVMIVDGETYAESDAMLRYAGKLSGLYPKDARAAMKVDMILSVLETITTALFKDKTAEARAKFVGEDIPRYFKPINEMYAATDGPFLLGNEMSIADLKIAVMVVWLNAAKILDHIPAGTLNKYEAMMKGANSVMSHEAVKKWNEEHA